MEEQKSMEPDSVGVSLFAIVCIVSTLALGGYFWLFRHRYVKKQKQETSPPPASVKPKGKPKFQKQSNVKPISSPPRKDKATQHALYCTTLKGFTRDITCVSINATGTKIVVSSGDSSLRVFSVNPESSSALSASVEKQSHVRGVVSGDFCTAVDLSVNDVDVFGATELSCKLIKLSPTKSQSGAIILQQVDESKTSIHKNSVRWLSSSKGKWIITGADGDDTIINVHSYTFERIASFDTKQVKNFHLTFSPREGRFFGAAAWSAGVKVMEVLSQKSGEVKKVDKAMDLGTPCGVNALCFSPDNRKALLACKDGTLIMWNIDVRYSANEDPKKIFTIKEKLTDTHLGYSQLAFSANSALIIGVSARSLRILNALDCSLVEVIEEDANIRSLSVSPVGHFCVTGTIDSKPRIWKLPAEFN